MVLRECCDCLAEQLSSPFVVSAILVQESAHVSPYGVWIRLSKAFPILLLHLAISCGKRWQFKAAWDIVGKLA